MITEDYISFETAKLLKEKGFIGDGDVGSRCGIYSEKDYEIGHGIITKTGRVVGLVYDDVDNSELESYEYLRPTLQMAMKWLREVYNIYIDVLLLDIKDGDYGYVILNTTTRDYLATSKNNSYNTPEEAAEDAIMYIIENLI